MTDMFLSNLRVPSGADTRMDDVRPVAGNKRSLESSSSFVESIMSTIDAKRRFQSGAVNLDALRSSLPSQLANAMIVTDTGFSTEDVQTDQTISIPILAKPFQEAWQADYVDCTPLFCSTSEPETHAQQLYTVASPAVLNFGLEMQEIYRDATLIGGTTAKQAEDIEALSVSLGHMMASSAQEIGDKWNYLGPMTNVLDVTALSSDANVRRAYNNERLINFSIYDRAIIFNMFGPHVVRGDYLYWCARDYDISHRRNVDDPRGRAVFARRKFPAHALQIMGASEHFMHTPHHNTSYDAVSGPESFTDPKKGDLDYVARLTRMAKEYRRMDFDIVTDRPIFRQVDENDVQENVNEVPQVIYEAYMEGFCRKVGYARSFEGKHPTEMGILDAHRSHDSMKMLQQMVIYHV